MLSIDLRAELPIVGCASFSSAGIHIEGVLSGIAVMSFLHLAQQDVTGKAMCTCPIFHRRQHHIYFAALCDWL